MSAQDASSGPPPAPETLQQQQSPSEASADAGIEESTATTHAGAVAHPPPSPDWPAFEAGVLSAGDPLVDVIMCIAYDGGAFSGCVRVCADVAMPARVL